MSKIKQRINLNTAIFIYGYKCDDGEYYGFIELYKTNNDKYFIFAEGSTSTDGHKCINRSKFSVLTTNEAYSWCLKNANPLITNKYFYKTA